VEPAVIAALVASATSVVVAVAGAALAYRNQRSTQAIKLEHDKELQRLQHQLSQHSAERQARLDYENDARKRLYAVTEPLLIQLAERAEDLQGHIAGLARTAHNGNLRPGHGWLSGDEYYRRSTVHRLLSPVALFHLMQDNMTQVDLGLEPLIRAQYSMAKLLAWALTDHYSFAACEPAVAYQPHIESENPDGGDRYQGLPSGVIETAGQSLIVRTAGGTTRAMRFGEFDEAYDDRNSPLYRACVPVTQLLEDFHPHSHPVLWRALITQSQLRVAPERPRPLRRRRDDSAVAGHPHRATNRVRLAPAR
jgi:hypothetical protein